MWWCLCNARSDLDGPSISVFAEMTSRTERKVPVCFEKVSPLIQQFGLRRAAVGIAGFILTETFAPLSFPPLSSPPIPREESILLKDKANCRRNFWMEGSYRPPRPSSVYNRDSLLLFWFLRLICHRDSIFYQGISRRGSETTVSHIKRGEESHLYGGRSRFAVWSVSPISRWFPPSLSSLASSSYHGDK